MLSEVLATDNRDNIMLNVVGCRTTEPTPQAQPGGLSAVQLNHTSAWQQTLTMALLPNGSQEVGGTHERSLKTLHTTR